MLLRTAAGTRGAHLPEAAADLQRAVHAVLGLVVVAHEPEEEAGVEQGPPAGRLARLLQAALQLPDGFLVCESEQEEGEWGGGGLPGPEGGTEGPGTCLWPR